MGRRAGGHEQQRQHQHRDAERTASVPGHGVPPSRRLRRRPPSRRFLVQTLDDRRSWCCDALDGSASRATGGTVADLGPLTITARNRDQAEYLVRSRAEQRAIRLQSLDVAEAGTGAWFVTVTVSDDDAAKLAAAQLDEDTQVLHFRSHASRR